MAAGEAAGEWYLDCKVRRWEAEAEEAEQILAASQTTSVDGPMSVLESVPEQRLSAWISCPQALAARCEARHSRWTSVPCSWVPLSHTPVDGVWKRGPKKPVLPRVEDPESAWRADERATQAVDQRTTHACWHFASRFVPPRHGGGREKHARRACVPAYRNCGPCEMQELPACPIRWIHPGRTGSWGKPRYYPCLVRRMTGLAAEPRVQCDPIRPSYSETRRAGSGSGSGVAQAASAEELYRVA